MTIPAFGEKRLVTGAQYGLKDWLAQRLTAVILGIYTIIVLIAFFCMSQFNYNNWYHLFAQPWFKFATFIMSIALAYHAWVGVRDIWMDYIKPVTIRLILHLLTLVWLIGCAGWLIQILWSIN